MRDILEKGGINWPYIVGQTSNEIRTYIYILFYIIYGVSILYSVHTPIN